MENTAEAPARAGRWTLDSFSPKIIVLLSELVLKVLFSIPNKIRA